MFRADKERDLKIRFLTDNGFLKNRDWHFILDKFILTDSGCWEWIGTIYSNGYGKFEYQKSQWRAHRLAYYFSYGQIPSGLFVCHKCDNPICINPTHLFVGTHQDNMDDAVEKGRSKLFGRKRPKEK